jgi:hypothetical protein
MTFLFWNGNQNAKKKWKFEINVREHRRGNQKRTNIERVNRSIQERRIYVGRYDNDKPTS